MAKANIVTLFKLLQKYDGEKSMTLGHWRMGLMTSNLKSM